MNNDTKQNDNAFLGELDIEHPDQTQAIKPTIVTPSITTPQTVQTDSNISLNQQNLQNNNTVLQPQQNIANPEPTNIDNNSIIAATNIINNTLPSDNSQLYPLQNQIAPNLANNGMYSTDPNNVATDITRGPQGSLNMVAPEQNQNTNAQPYINKPIYGGIIDSSQTNDNVTIKPPAKKKPPYKNKKLLLIVAGLILMVSLIFGAIFGLYLPNTPNNVWNTGLNRTGKQTSAVIDALSDPKVAESLKKSKIEAGGTITNNDQTFNVISNVAIDANNSDTTAQIKASIPQEEDIVADVAIKTELPDTALLPNVYFKFGLNNTSLFQSLSIPEKYNNVWISAEQDFMDQIAKSLNIEQDDAKNITKEDIISIVNDFNIVSQQYIFNSDPQYAVIVQKSFVGEEVIDDAKTNHYKASVNKDNAKQYCNALNEKLINNESFVKYFLSGDTNLEARKQENKQECENTVNDIPDNIEFDIWINKSIKIVQLVRFYEDFSKQEEDAKKRKAECLQSYGAFGASACDYVDDIAEKGQRYIEFGQTIKSKKELSLYTATVSDTDKDKSNIKSTIYVNSDTYNLNGQFTAKIDNPDNKVNADLNFKMTPFNDNIDSDKPKNAIPIQQFIEDSQVRF